MLKLYGGARSRASIVQWYLEELAIPYEFVMLNMQAGEHRQPPFLAINPMGKVPAIVDGDFTLWESGAILLYLSDQYEPSAKSPAQRAEIAQWVLYANATLGPGLFVETNRQRELHQLTALDQILAAKPYLLGEQFSAADVAVGAVLAYMPIMLQFDFSPYPSITAYLQRLAERPAFQATIGKRS
ncbi:MAG: glutathione S-transferase family protein [Cyanobacteria bacterium]|nr:glutathione S-transferase family protein [Cyanobacteriota bacterium]MDW8201839.1 glutathione S-transferase family protein [Cyanobacteriota bacterium SKYGB_h_bin112]